MPGVPGDPTAARAGATGRAPVVLRQPVQDAHALGITRTAPYFHDTSAKDLNEVLRQYDWFFANSPQFGGLIVLTPQDKEDIQAFLRLL